MQSIRLDVIATGNSGVGTQREKDTLVELIERFSLKTMNNTVFREKIENMDKEKTQ